MCEKNNAQQSVTKTPKETESREEVRMFEVSTDSLKKKTFQIYRLSDAKQSNHESNATSVKELLRIVSEANGHLTPNLWV